MKKLMLATTLMLLSSNAFANPVNAKVGELPLSHVKRTILAAEKRVCYTASGTISVMISCVPLTNTSAMFQADKEMASLAYMNGLMVIRDLDLNNSCLVAKIDRGAVDIKCTNLPVAQ